MDIFNPVPGPAIQLLRRIRCWAGVRALPRQLPSGRAAAGQELPRIALILFGKLWEKRRLGLRVSLSWDVPRAIFSFFLV